MYVKLYRADHKKFRLLYNIECTLRQRAIQKRKNIQMVFSLLCPPPDYLTKVPLIKKM